MPMPFRLCRQVSRQFERIPPKFFGTVMQPRPNSIQCCTVRTGGQHLARGEPALSKEVLSTTAPSLDPKFLHEPLHSEARNSSGSRQIWMLWRRPLCGITYRWEGLATLDSSLFLDLKQQTRA